MKQGEEINSGWNQSQHTDSDLISKSVPRDSEVNTSCDSFVHSLITWVPTARGLRPQLFHLDTVPASTPVSRLYTIPQSPGMASRAARPPADMGATNSSVGFGLKKVPLLARGDAALKLTGLNLLVAGAVSIILTVVLPPSDVQRRNRRSSEASRGRFLA